MRIGETVLEMHFHSALMKLIEEKLGLGPKASFNFYKYSPQLEKFIGFDQAYVMSQLSDKVLFSKLKTAALTSDYKMGPKFVGLFLQFKVVHELKKKSKTMPPSIKSAPCYRVSLYTSRTATNVQSQHELLYQLSKNTPGAFVYYACPMIFDKVKLYAPPNMADLRLAKVDSCPGPYTDNDKHYIFYATPNAAPIWKSDPVIGEAVGPEDMATSIANYFRETSAVQSLENLRAILSAINVSSILAQEAPESTRNLVLEAFTILAINEKR